MGGSCQPSGGIKNMVGKPGNAKQKGTPNSRLDITDIVGNILQQIWYGFDGFIQWMRDWSHGNKGGEHDFPHDHEFENGQKVPDNGGLDTNPDYC